MCSVVPEVIYSLRSCCRKYFNIDPFILQSGAKTGLKIRYRNPLEVGPDRIAKAIGAVHLYPGRNAIIVDFGTATTFDCVTPKGEYLGGIIAPGVQISADALFARAAKLPRVEIAKPAKIVGRNTVHSMQSGIVYGYVGLVDGIVERTIEELGYTCAVIATGGLARLIAPLSRTVNHVDDELTLVGLRILYERNAT